MRKKCLLQPVQTLGTGLVGLTQHDTWQALEEME